MKKQKNQKVNKPKLFKMSMEDYNLKMNEIMANSGSVADTLINMISFAGQVEIMPTEKKIIKSKKTK